jgi:hypothetical protein
MRSPFRIAVLPLTVLLLGVAPSGASSQPAALVPVNINGIIGGKQFSTSGQGECKHAPVAAIYGVRSAMWTLRFSGPPTDTEVHNLYFTLWRPLEGDAPDQFNLSMRAIGTIYEIDTVKGSTNIGSGTVTFRPTAGPGNFELQGRARDGTEVRLRLYCQSFTRLQPVGG